MADRSAEKPAWQEWLVGIVGALLVSAVVSGIGLYAAAEGNRTQIKTLSDSVNGPGRKVEKISGQVAGTEQAVGILANTIERSIRETLAAQDRRISAAEARGHALCDQRAPARA